MKTSARMTMAGLLAAGAAAIAIAGCSSSSTTPSPGPCGGVSGPVALVYPAPGSTAIPANLPGVVFGVTTALTSQYQAILVPNASSSQFVFNLVQPAPSPLPTPNTIPTFANPIYQWSPYASFTGILPSASLINVYLNDLNSNCTPTQIGSFTTQ